ncbi:hypothetical protein [Terriglobus sp. RCC_193]|uniref:hypothetical protein n=1 Tax=Terriglobus sp. RCC_193 TaxID=3239218 RepID=UPI0035263B94
MLDLIIRGLAHVLIPMFLIGMGGSAIVVAITLVKDMHDFFSDNGEESSAADNLH